MNLAENLIKMQIQFRRDTSVNWELHKDVKPAAGEPCFVIDKNILKIGDGVTAFGDLPAIGGVDFDVDGDSIVLQDGVLKLLGFDAAKVGAQPVKNEEGKIEWKVPSTKLVDDLRADVTDLQKDVADLITIVGGSESGTGTLISRIETLETKADGVEKLIDDKIAAFASELTEDGKVNTLMELIGYVETHGKEAANLTAQITDLYELVGTTSVKDQILEIVNASGHMAEKKAKALFEHVKYEVTHKPEGALVDYREKEIRVMCPADTKWVKQNVGATGNSNMYYMGFKAYAPEGAVSFKEGDRGVVTDEMFTFDNDFAGVDEFGRKYSICWLALASYNEETGKWKYFGETSTVNKYVGWTYCVEWYDANGVKIDSDCIRINLSNESCHNVIEPFYMANVVKEVSVNGTLLEMVDGRVNIDLPKIKESDEIAVAEDGTLSVKTISFSKIVQDEDTIIIMDGGRATK